MKENNNKKMLLFLLLLLAVAISTATPIAHARFDDNGRVCSPNFPLGPDQVPCCPIVYTCVHTRFLIWFLLLFLEVRFLSTQTMPQQGLR